MKMGRRWRVSLRIRADPQYLSHPRPAFVPRACYGRPVREDAWTHGFAEANGVRFHFVEAGEGPLLLLLHGFPELWYSWRHQIAALAERFHVVAPDLRGYNETSKPASGYDTRTLVADVVGLSRALGHARFRLAGHDWGGMVAWATAARHPELVERLSILNAPHPTAMARALRSNVAQMRRSWYIFAIQIPGFAEARIRRDGYALIDRMIRGQMVHPERMSDADSAIFRAAIARPGALDAALAYYRAAFRAALAEGFRAPNVDVRVPTQVIWGERDHALGVELLDGLDRWVPDLEVHRIPTASHWVQQDEPELVTALMAEFLS
jgi:epoxide hydrolase 4